MVGDIVIFSASRISRPRPSQAWNKTLLLRLFIGFALTYAASLLVCILSVPELNPDSDLKLVPVSIYYKAFELSKLFLFIFVPFTLWAGSLLQGGERTEKILVLLFIALWIGSALFDWHMGGKDLQFEVNERYTIDISKTGGIIISGLAGFAVSFFLIFVPWFTYKLWLRIKNN